MNSYHEESSDQNETASERALVTIRTSLEQGHLQQAADEMEAALKMVRMEGKSEEVDALLCRLSELALQQGLADRVFPLVDRYVSDAGSGSTALLDAATVLALHSGEQERAESLAMGMLARAEAAESDAGKLLARYMHAIRTAGEVDDWSGVRELKKRAVKRIAGVENPAEVRRAFDGLYAEGKRAVDEERYRIAEVLFELALKAAPKTMQDSMRLTLKEVSSRARMERELYQMMGDKRMYPGIVYRAMQQFFHNPNHPLVEAMAASLQDEGAGRMMTDRRSAAAGVLYLKKKYPSTYKGNKQLWDTYFEEQTAGMSREEKRHLKS